VVRSCLTRAGPKPQIFAIATVEPHDLANVDPSADSKSNIDYSQGLP
jgi:hypothetical protein